jgi:hypothetical protein
MAGRLAMELVVMELVTMELMVMDGEWRDRTG